MNLTKTQLAYLRGMDGRDYLQQGWGGYASALVIRHLEELGLCRIPLAYTVGPWRAYITDAGRRALASGMRTCGDCGALGDCGLYGASACDDWHEPELCGTTPCDECPTRHCGYEIEHPALHSASGVVTP